MRRTKVAPDCPLKGGKEVSKEEGEERNDFNWLAPYSTLVTISYRKIINNFRLEQLKIC